MSGYFAWNVFFWIQLKDVREFVPNVSNDNIILALEYYQYDTEQTVAAFLESKFWGF